MATNLREGVMVGAARTAIGEFAGTLSARISQAPARQAALQWGRL